MRKNHVRRIVIQRSESGTAPSLADRVSEFHADVMGRRLAASGLSPAQQRAVIERIMEKLKAQEQSAGRL